MEGGEAISWIKLFHFYESSVYAQLHNTWLQLWAVSCERASHANIGSNNGLWHRINTLDSENKGIICLFNTMELIQSQSCAGQIRRFQDFLNGEKSRSKVHESGKLAALANQAKHRVIQYIQYPTRCVGTNWNPSQRCETTWPQICPHSALL